MVVPVSFIFVGYVSVVISLLNDVVSAWSEENQDVVAKEGSRDLICFNESVS